MHHSNDKRRRSFALAHYIDDSGSDERSATAVMGGPVFAEGQFCEFHYEWSRVADTHEVKLPIHMNEFSRPHGRLASVSDERRRNLFLDLVFLINMAKAYSLTIAVDNEQFQSTFSPSLFRQHLTSTSYAFMWCMVLNRSIVKRHDLRRMALVVANSPQNTQITDAHTFFTSYEECRDEDFIGSLTFEKPQAAHALQAADLVAWANLRKHLKLPFDNGLEPLELLTRDVESEHKPILHFHYPTSAKSVEKLAEVLRAPVRQKGIRSSVLGEFVPDEWKEKIKKLPTE